MQTGIWTVFGFILNLCIDFGPGMAHMSIDCISFPRVSFFAWCGRFLFDFHFYRRQCECNSAIMQLRSSPLWHTQSSVWKRRQRRYQHAQRTPISIEAIPARRSRCHISYGFYSFPFGDATASKTQKLQLKLENLHC